MQLLGYDQSASLRWIKSYSDIYSTLKTYQRTVLVQTGVYSKGSTGFFFYYSKTWFQNKQGTGVHVSLWQMGVLGHDCSEPCIAVCQGSHVTLLSTENTNHEMLQITSCI